MPAEPFAAVFDAVALPPVGKTRAVVLLVDDDAEVRLVMAASLARGGHEVLEAASGSAALDLFRDGGAFDVVIVDYAMPGMTGSSAISEMLERRPTICFLLVTGLANGEKLRHWPAEHILCKPFSPDELLHRVSELLQRARNGTE